MFLLKLREIGVVCYGVQDFFLTPRRTTAQRFTQPVKFFELDIKIVKDTLHVNIRVLQLKCKGVRLLAITISSYYHNQTEKVSAGSFAPKGE